MKSPPIITYITEEEAKSEEPSKVIKSSNKHQAKHRRQKERRLMNAEERLQKNLQLLSQGKCPVWLDTEVEEYEFDGVEKARKKKQHWNKKYHKMIFSMNGTPRSTQ